MNQNSSQRSLVPGNNFEFSANELSEVNRLLHYIEQTAISSAKLRRIDSENTPIHATEIPIVANLVIGGLYGGMKIFSKLFKKH